MEGTKVSTEALGGLPTSRVLTLVNAHHVGLVLSEVESLTRMYFVPDRLVKVRVVDFTVLINIELVEYELELLLSQLQAPVREVEPELILSNSIISLLIDVRERLPDRLPLSLDLLNDGLLEDHVHQLLGGLIFVFLLPFRLVADLVLLELRIFDRVVPKVEALALMDRVAHPFAEVGIAQAAFARRVFIQD